MVARGDPDNFPRFRRRNGAHGQYPKLPLTVISISFRRLSASTCILFMINQQILEVDFSSYWGLIPPLPTLEQIPRNVQGLYVHVHWCMGHICPK